MVTGDGRVKITDFGIARATQRAGTQYMTATGMTVGTPTYMAPEQAMAGDIGPWSDLYSVGVLTYELVVGHVPFHDTDAPMVILMRHVNERIPSAVEIRPDVDPKLSEWIDKLLVKDPQHRTRHAVDAWESLEDIVVGLLGPLWRRDARLLDDQLAVSNAVPLTPAPFESQPSIRTPTPASSPAVADEFVTFDPSPAAADAPRRATPPPPCSPAAGEPSLRPRAGARPPVAPEPGLSPSRLAGGARAGCAGRAASPSRRSPSRWPRAEPEPATLGAGLRDLRAGSPGAGAPTAARPVDAPSRARRSRRPSRSLSLPREPEPEPEPVAAVPEPEPEPSLWRRTEPERRTGADRTPEPMPTPVAAERPTSQAPGATRPDRRAGRGGHRDRRRHRLPGGAELAQGGAQGARAQPGRLRRDRRVAQAPFPRRLADLQHGPLGGVGAEAGQPDDGQPRGLAGQGRARRGHRTDVDSDLLPTGFTQSLGSAAQGAPVKLGSNTFMRFVDVVPSSTSTALSVYALPTQQGTAIAACVLPPPAPPRSTAPARASSRRFSPRAPVLPLGANPRSPRRWAGSSSKLNGTRSSAGHQLAGAKSQKAQAAAAKTLAGAYQQAAAAAAKLQPGPVGTAGSQAIVAALHQLATGYQALGTAAAHNNKKAYATAGAAIGKAQTALSAGVRPAPAGRLHDRLTGPRRVRARDPARRGERCAPAAAVRDARRSRRRGSAAATPPPD